MTTLVGIEAQQGKPGIVLASDLTASIESWVDKGDVAVRKQEKETVQKIYVSDDKNLAVCMTGTADLAYNDFLQALLRGEFDFKKYADEVERQEGAMFNEARNLTLSRWGGRLPNNDMNSFLIATRYDGKPRLLTCYPLGITERINSTSIGSGSRYAIEKLSLHRSKIPKYTSLKDAVEWSVEALEAAQRDAHTGGLDLVVVTADGIEEHGASISNAISEARSRAVSSIIGRL